MIRICGINIPDDKKIYISLTYIFGIGKKIAHMILYNSKIYTLKLAKHLTDYEISRIRQWIEHNLKIEGDLKNFIYLNIKRLKNIRCYRGLRHQLHLPVRGQRTHSNAKTCRKYFTGKKYDKKKKKINKNAVVNIIATFNNTIITISDIQGNTLMWSSCGFKGFKGAKKNTPYAAQIVTDSICKKAKNAGIKTFSIKIKGPGIGRDAALRSIINCGIQLLSIKDITGAPHNGCRPPKKRRI